MQNLNLLKIAKLIPKTRIVFIAGIKTPVNENALIKMIKHVVRQAKNVTNHALAGVMMIIRINALHAILSILEKKKQFVQKNALTICIR